MKKKILDFLTTKKKAAAHFKKDQPDEIIKTLLEITKDELATYDIHLNGQARQLVKFLYHNEQVSIKWAVELAIYVAKKQILDGFLHFGAEMLDDKFWAAEIQFRALPLAAQFEQWNALVGKTGNHLQCIFDLSIGLNLEGPPKIIRNIIVYYVEEALEPTVPKLEEMLFVLKEQLRPWMPRV